MIFTTSRRVLSYSNHYISLILVLITIQSSSQYGCTIRGGIWYKGIKANQNCDTKGRIAYSNIPQLSGVHCYNNGSGLCKAFSGQFEFHFIPHRDEIVGPVPSSEFVDQYGFHSRIPVSYNELGQINYADLSINFAKLYAEQNPRKNLLSQTSINWCLHVKNGFWPYRSTMKYTNPKTGDIYQIYFFNRQSCIHKLNDTDGLQHYNTRFLHRSKLRIDLDQNPTIFAMQDLLDGDRVHMVKHKRQHFLEQSFKVIENPNPNVKLFVEMKNIDQEQLTINYNRPLLSHKAYRKLTDICITDHYHLRAKGQYNSPLLPVACGVETMEVADLPGSMKKNPRLKVHELGLHGLADYPRESQELFGTIFKSEEEWMQFARQGVTYSAMTTIPDDDSFDSFTLITIGSTYNFANPSSVYDQFYPKPFISKYLLVKVKSPKDPGVKWAIDNLVGPDVQPSLKHWRRREVQTWTPVTLNYPDDLTYLHKCKTILTIFGALYSEQPVKTFSHEADANIGSISAIGSWELINAALANADSNSMWLYHRGNWMSEVRYTCGRGGNLSTAVRTGKYYPRDGYDQPPFIKQNPFFFFEDSNTFKGYSEEQFWKDLGLFKSPSWLPNPPDPAKYPLPPAVRPTPEVASNPSWLLILLAIAALIIISMCVVCLLTTRRRRRRQRLQEAGSTITDRSGISAISTLGRPTARSSIVSTRSSAIPSTRSSRLASSATSNYATTTRSPLLVSGRPRSLSTTRSALSSRSHGPPIKPMSTARSSLANTSSPNLTKNSSRSSSRSSTRSAIKGTTKGIIISSMKDAGTSSRSRSSSSSTKGKKVKK